MRNGTACKPGGLGDIAAFSFYPTKNLSAAGDAGMVTTNSEELAERARMLRQHGMRRRYYHDEIGWNARMDGFQGAILEVKLKYIDGWNEARRAVAATLPCAVSRRRPGRSRSPTPTQGIVLPHEVPGSKHVWHQYVIRTAAAMRCAISSANARSDRRSTIRSRCTCRKR